MENHSEDYVRGFRAGLEDARKIVCKGCREDWPFEGMFHVNDLGTSRTEMICMAMSLRQRILDFTEEHARSMAR
jgi:hypothetical protein